MKQIQTTLSGLRWFALAVLTLGLLAGYMFGTSSFASAASFHGMTTFASTLVSLQERTSADLLIVQSEATKSTGLHKCLIEVPFKYTQGTMPVIHVKGFEAMYTAVSCSVVSTDFSVVKMQCLCRKLQ